MPPLPQISQLFTRLNKPLLHASAGDKSLHPALTGSVINHSLTDPRLDWTVCLCSVTLLPWYASRFTPTKSQWQTRTMPRTCVSSLRHLSDGSESRRGPRWPGVFTTRVCFKALGGFPRTELSATGVAVSGKEAGRMCFYWQHINTWLFIDCATPITPCSVYICQLQPLG